MAKFLHPQIEIMTSGEYTYTCPFCQGTTRTIHHKWNRAPICHIGIAAELEELIRRFPIRGCPA